MRESIFSALHYKRKALFGRVPGYYKTSKEILKGSYQHKDANLFHIERFKEFLFVLTNNINMLLYSLEDLPMTTTRSAKGNGLVQRLAAEWIQELGLQGFVGHPEDLFNMPGIIQRIKRLGPSTLGVIAWHGAPHVTHGRTSLYGVAQGAGVGSKYAGGKDYLRCLARTAMVAEMFDQLGQPYEDHQARMERLAAYEELDRAERDCVHHSSPDIKIPIPTLAELREFNEE
jgi:hypothetical protein